MDGLTNKLRSQGGKNRAKSQDPDERKFLAMVAASRRPLLHDANLTPEVLLGAFKGLRDSRHWFYVVIVGADRSTIPFTTDSEVLRRVEKAGGPIGFLGVTMLGTNVQVYYKPLKRGIKAVEDLDRVSRDAMADVLDQLGRTDLAPLEG